MSQIIFAPRVVLEVNYIVKSQGWPGVNFPNPLFFGSRRDSGFNKLTSRVLDPRLSRLAPSLQLPDRDVQGHIIHFYIFL